MRLRALAVDHPVDLAERNIYPQICRADLTLCRPAPAPDLKHCRRRISNSVNLSSGAPASRLKRPQAGERRLRCVRCASQNSRRRCSTREKGSADLYQRVALSRASKRRRAGKLARSHFLDLRLPGPQVDPDVRTITIEPTTMVASATFSWPRAGGRKRWS